MPKAQRRPSLPQKPIERMNNFPLVKSINEASRSPDGPRRDGTTLIDSPTSQLRSPRDLFGAKAEVERLTAEVNQLSKKVRRLEKENRSLKTQLKLAIVAAETRRGSSPQTSPRGRSPTEDQ